MEKDRHPMHVFLDGWMKKRPKFTRKKTWMAEGYIAYCIMTAPPNKPEIGIRITH